MTLPTFFEMLNTLVSSPSVSSLSPDLDTSNRAVIDHMANWLHDLDFDVDVLASSDDRKFNLVARKGRGEGGVLLSGHSDTVPCDPDLWTQSPFSVKTDDSKYYGLGTCDMKGFFPSSTRSGAAIQGISTGTANHGSRHSRRRVDDGRSQTYSDQPPYICRRCRDR